MDKDERLKTIESAVKNVQGYTTLEDFEIMSRLELDFEKEPVHDDVEEY